MIALHKLFEAGFTKSGRFMPNTASLAQQSKRKSNMTIKDPDQLQTRHLKFKTLSKYIPKKTKLGKSIRRSYRTSLPGYSKSRR